jgi:hypothetical protein
LLVRVDRHDRPAKARIEQLAPISAIAFGRNSASRLRMVMGLPVESG